jgi:hypothetical protein
MSKIPYTDNDFRRLTVFDVQEITTTIYSAELRFDYEEQSIYYGVLDSIVKKSSLLTDPEIIPLISQFILYGDRVGNVPQQYTSLISFRNTEFEEADGVEQGGGERGGGMITPDNTYQILYYAIPNSLDVQNTRFYRRLQLPRDWYANDIFFFYYDVESVRKYAISYPPLEIDETSTNPTYRKVTRLFVAECVVDNRIIADSLLIEPDPVLGIDVRGIAVQTIYQPYIIAQNVIEISLVTRKRSLFRPRRAKIGTR